MTEFVLEPLDEDDEAVEISLGDIDLGDGVSLEALDAAPRQQRRQGSGGSRGAQPSDTGLMGFMNRGILQGVTAPLDFLHNVSAPLAGRVMSDEAVARTQRPSERWGDLFRSIGGASAPADADPREEGLGAQVGDFLGLTLASAPYLSLIHI